MTQPTERRFVMEPRLDAEVETINNALDTKANLTDPRFTDQRTPLDNSVTSAKIADGAIVNADINASAAIAPSKIDGTAVTQADTQSVTSTMIVDGTIVNGDIADNTIESVKLAAQDYIKFDTTYAGGSTQPGMVAWNDTDGTLEFQLKGGNVTLQIGQEQVVRVKNDTGAALSNGKAVYISGSNGTNLLASYANAGAENTSAGTIGIVTEDIASNGHGFVTTFGLVRNINTAGLTEGAPVWLASTDGGLTSTRPAAPAHSAMLGFCLRASATVGVVFVRVDNGWELDELHNVLITSPTNGQALTYDSVSGLWKNATPVNSLSGLSDVAISSPSGGQVIKYNAGTSKWVNGAAAGGVTAAATAPDLASAAAGDAWFDTNDGTLYVCYVDTDSTKQWVQVQANSALEGSILARLGALEGQSIAYGAMSPNYIINGAFDIWQRGTSFTANGFTADRWKAGSDTTFTVSRQAFTANELPISSVGEAQYYFRHAKNSGGSWLYFSYQVEDVRTLAGQTATVSFYAKANSTQTLKLQPTQFMGTGGSGGTSAPAQTVSVGTTWQRYSMTFAIPSNAGKTIGSNSSLYWQFDVTTASAATLDLWGVQLEAGSTATTFRRNAPSVQAELAACQRYFEAGSSTDIYLVSNNSYSEYNLGTGNYPVMYFKVPKRVSPTIRNWYGGTANVANVLGSNPANGVFNLSVNSVQFGINSVGSSGNTQAYFGWDASAEL